MQTRPSWAQLGTHQQQLEEFSQREHQARAEKESEEQALARRVQEVRDYFGYWVDPADPRFSIMLHELEEKAKLDAKLAKKEAKKKQKQQLMRVLTGQQAEEEEAKGWDWKLPNLEVGG